MCNILFSLYAREGLVEGVEENFDSVPGVDVWWANLFPCLDGMVILTWIRIILIHSTLRSSSFVNPR